MTGENWNDLTGGNWNDGMTQFEAALRELERVQRQAAANQQAQYGPAQAQYREPSTEEKVRFTSGPGRSYSGEYSITMVAGGWFVVRMQSFPRHQIRVRATSSALAGKMASECWNAENLIEVVGVRG